MIGTPSRVFVADDHALFREGVKSLLAEESDLVVAGESGSAKETLASNPQRCVRHPAARHLAPRRFGDRPAAPDPPAQAGPPDSHPVDAPGGAVRGEPAARRRERLPHQGCGAAAGRAGDPHAAPGPQVHQPRGRAHSRRRHRQRPPARARAALRAGIPGLLQARCRAFGRHHRRGALSFATRRSAPTARAFSKR